METLEIVESMGDATPKDQNKSVVLSPGVTMFNISNSVSNEHQLFETPELKTLIKNQDQSVSYLPIQGQSNKSFKGNFNILDLLHSDPDLCNKIIKEKHYQSLNDVNISTIPKVLSNNIIKKSNQNSLPFTIPKELFGNKKEYYYYNSQKFKDKALFHSTQVKYPVCWAGPNKHLFINFESRHEFLQHFIQVPEDLRCFFEIYDSKLHNGVKLYYDLDLDTKQCHTIEHANYIMNSVIKSTIDLFPVRIIPADFSIYTTHREEKFSFHIVLNGYMFYDHTILKDFVSEMHNKISNDIKEFIDLSVYKSVQQLRFIGNKKFNTSVVKTQLESFEYFEYPVTSKYTSEEDSLIANIDNCQPVQWMTTGPVEPFLKPKVKLVDSSNSEQDSINVDEIVKLFKLEFDKEDIWEYIDYVDNIINLKRKKPAYCEFHKRIHEHENAFLSITGKTQRLQFHCRRDPPPNKKLLVILKPELSDQSNTLKELYSFGEENYARVIQKKCSNSVKMCTTKGPLYVYNDKNKLWEEQDTGYIFSTLVKLILVPIIKKHAEPYEQVVGKCKTKIIQIRTYAKQMADLHLMISQTNPITLNPIDLQVYWQHVTNIQNYQTQQNLMFASIGPLEEEMKIANFQLGKFNEMTSFISKKAKADNIAAYLHHFLIDKDFFNTLNKIPHLLPVKTNKVLNLKTLKLEDRVKDHLFTYEIDIKYDPKIKDDLWEDLLYKFTIGSKDLQDYLQLVFGYAVTGEMCVKKGFFLHGETNSMKSTFIAVLKFVFGSSSFFSTANKALFTVEYKRGGPTPELYKIRNSRLVIVNELDEHDTFATGFFKTLTSGGVDEVEARPNYHRGDPLTFIPSFKLFFLTNFMINVKSDPSVLLRMVVIPCLASITIDPIKVSDIVFMKDDTFMDKIKVSKTAKQAIFNWLVKGAYQYYNGSNLDDIPSEVNEATESFRKGCDSVKTFFEHYCIQDPNESVTSADAYSMYKSYCEENHLNKEVLNEFSKRMRELSEYSGDKGQRTNTYAIIRGIRFISLLTDLTNDTKL